MNFNLKTTTYENTKKKISLTIIGSFLIFSCEIDEKENITNLETGFSVEDNILSFKTSSDLKTYVDGLKDDFGSEVIVEKLKKSYDNGFLPLNPQTDNEALIQKIVAERKKINTILIYNLD